MSAKKQPTKPSSSALKVFKTLDVLSRSFATGLSNAEIAKATGFTPSMIVIHVTTLIEAGYAEKIVDTERYRPSVRFAQKAMSITRSIENTQSQIDELKQRVTVRIS